MSIERIYYCDGPDCASHCRTATPPPYLPPGFVETREWSETEATFHYFCTWDCLMKFAAQSPPPEIIPWGPSEDSNGA